MKIKKERIKKDKLIMFCPKCNWKLINPEEDEKINICPKCKSWNWEIFQFYHYENGKEVGREFGITDNDEVFFSAYDFKEAKKIIDKSFKLFKECK
ncbi:MAG: hypothetical protein KKB88_05365 [Nanoarchaeota archaeon]|nr:hypothetical protein [Nanoarchaeota archaeon]